MGTQLEDEFLEFLGNDTGMLLRKADLDAITSVLTDAQKEEIRTILGRETIAAPIERILSASEVRS